MPESYLINAQDNWSFQPHPITFHSNIIYGIFVLVLLLNLGCKFGARRRAIANTKLEQEEQIADNEKRIHQYRRTTNICGIICFLLFFGMEYALRVGRLLVLVGLANSYKPAINDDTGELVFLFRDYYEAKLPSNEALIQDGCESLVSASASFSEPPEDACSILVASLPLTMASGASFSMMVVGFIIYPVLVAAVVRFQFVYQERYAPHMKDKPRWQRVCYAIATSLVFYIFFFLATVQQSMVLMPTAIVTPHHFFLDIHLPPNYFSTEGLLCQHSMATSGLPMGIPFVFGALACLGCFLCCGFRHYGERVVYVDPEAENTASVFTCALLVGFFVFAATGVVLIGAWLLLGLFLGPWLHVSYFSQHVFVIAEVMAPILIVVNSIPDAMIL